MNYNTLPLRLRSSYETYEHWSFSLTKGADRKTRRALFKKVWQGDTK